MLGNGMINTMEDDNDIYISLTELCEYLALSAAKMSDEAKDIPAKDKKYAQGLVDMMYTIAEEFVELGKFEAQRRMINNPQDLLDMVDKNPFGKVE